MVLHEIRHTLRLIRRNPLTLTGLSIVSLLVVVALFAPWVAPYPNDINTSHMANKLQPPSLAHPCGTDELGRDVSSRLVFGCRISLQIGFLTIGLSLLIGVPLGVIAGYSGGKVDEIIMRVSDMVLSFPSLLLAMAITAMLGPNLQNAMIAIAISWWPWYTRLLRSEAISVKEREYVAAAKAIGASWGRIVFRHVLRNSLTSLIIQISVDFGAVIMTSAALSFLGLGAQPPTPEWGLMINIGRDFFLSYWWIVTFPGVAIFVTVLGFNLVGDGAREILDPRLSRRGR